MATAFENMERAVLPVQTQKTADAVAIFQYFHSQQIVKNRNVQTGGFRFQCLGHKFGGQRTCGCGSGIGVMVGFVAGIFSVSICREGNAQLAQMQKAPGGQCRFAQGVISVGATAGKQVFCHISHAVSGIAAKS